MSTKSQHQIQYCVFDIMFLGYENVMTKPLYERKRLLEGCLIQNENIVLVQHVQGAGIEYYNAVKERGLEGIVLKKANSIYRPDSRPNFWLKVINYQYKEIFISGLRKNKFGILLSFEDGRPAGVLEFMKPKDRKILYTLYRELIIKEDDKFIYLKPVLKGKVKYRNLTSKGLLRIPSFEQWIS